MTYSNPAAYERFMGRWSAHLAPLFAEFTGIQDGQRILDVGCGTGSLSRTLLASGETTSVVGVDPTEDYVSFAQLAAGQWQFHQELLPSAQGQSSELGASPALLMYRHVS